MWNDAWNNAIGNKFKLTVLFFLVNKGSIIDAKNINIWQHENVTSGLKTSAPQQNNGSPSDGKSLQRAVTHPSIINESSADWILSIKWCQGAVCPRRAAWHRGLNHKCNNYCNNERLFISILSPKCTVCPSLGHNINFQIAGSWLCCIQVCIPWLWPFY